MSLRGLHRWFLSARVTVLLLCLLALLLLLSIVLPQDPTHGAETVASLARERPVMGFLLETLGMRRMATSPVFLAVLGLFFLNLALVLASRVGPTWRRIAIRPRSEKGLEAWSRLEERLDAPLPAGWKTGEAARTLRGFGYQVRRPGERILFGVKHRTAPLGFLLFHLSFFLLCAGGVLIYYTRFVGSAVLSEGQPFLGRYTEVERRPLLGEIPSPDFALVSVDPRFERGEPVHLSALFRFERGGSSFERRARVNDPARWGAATLLVNQAGLAPVLWLQDGQGFTLDRVAAPVRTRGGEPTDIPVLGGRWTLRVFPLGPARGFPARGDFPETALRFELDGEEGRLFEGSLRPGEAASFPGGRLVLEELRYWVGFRVIAERGGGLLVAGFVLGTLGLIWRLLLYRRELVVSWDDRELRLVGRAEYFSARFRRELGTVRDTLARGPGSVATAPAVEGRPGEEEEGET